MMCELFIHSIVKESEVWDIKLFTSYPLTANNELNLPAVLMMCELLIKNIIKKSELSMIYKTVHKLSINTKHWSKLTVCIDDVCVIDTQYHWRNWSMRYEAVHKSSINNKHWLQK